MLEKYLLNKDLKVTDKDFDLESLKADLTKDYVSSKDVEKRVSDSVKEKTTELTKQLSDLQASYDSLNKNYTTTTDRVKELSLENIMVRKGFQDKDFKEISKLRSSLYGDEKDDSKAIDLIAEKFGNTYLPKKEEELPIPKESSVGVTQTTTKETPILRNTRLKDLVVKR
jgi:predicted nuclease with TOPRIM domain